MNHSQMVAAGTVTFTLLYLLPLGALRTAVALGWYAA